MNYEKIYNDFIKDRLINRNGICKNNYKRAQAINSCEAIYREIHHIVPKSLGGSNDADNLIILEPTDHLFAHVMLAKIYPSNKMIYALNCMLKTDNKYKRFTNKAIRKTYSFTRNRSGHSEETKLKISKANKNPSAKVRKSMGFKNIGRKLTDEHKAILSKTGKAYWENNVEAKAIVSARFKDRVVSDATRKKLSKSSAGINNGMYGRIPHNCRKVNKFDINDTFLEQYLSISATAKANKCTDYLIATCCNDHSKIHNGYKYRFQEQKTK